ncbi:cobalamin biosynthesis protein [Paracoccus sp. MBLB3053]|uniref:Cobalamin biosynthesis protein n=1 Tax=Paracoccus aurantius TaxID=3073814 RepID=A0ABU2HUN6_9RHOB|nr:cobalamin biosynthesis protein [Paracoccus sp. MBLB3053]MDS9468245.1 cobalamin biosynthesis protein [Paracoccus sp. MBLB3053]
MEGGLSRRAVAGPAVIVAGFGFRSNASAESLADAFRQAADGRAVALAVTAEDKASSDAFRQFCATLGISGRGIDAATLARQKPATRSAASIQARGLGSLAEAAALAAAGPQARLLGPRAVSSDRMATCALAEGGGS